MIVFNFLIFTSAKYFSKKWGVKSNEKIETSGHHKTLIGTGNDSEIYPEIKQNVAKKNGIKTIGPVGLSLSRSGEGKQTIFLFWPYIMGFY